MSKRITKKPVPGANYDKNAATALAASIVASQIRREKLIAQRDEAMNYAAANFRPLIDQADAEINDGLLRLEAWAKANAAEFGNAESMTLAGGHRVGWRMGNWVAKPMKGWTWKKIKAALEETPKPWRDLFLRVKTTVNKAGLVAARETHELSSLGVRFDQVRRFYLEPHRED